VVDLEQHVGVLRVGRLETDRDATTRRNWCVLADAGQLVELIRIAHCGATSFSRSASSMARRRLGIRPCGRKIMTKMITRPNRMNLYSARSVPCGLPGVPVNGMCRPVSRFGM